MEVTFNDNNFFSYISYVTTLTTKIIICSLYNWILITLLSGLFLSIIIWYGSKAYFWQNTIKAFSSFLILRFILLLTLNVSTLLSFITLYFFSYLIKLCSKFTFLGFDFYLNMSLISNNHFFVLSIDFFGVILCCIAFFVALLSFLALDTRLYWKNSKFIFICNVLSLFVYLFVSTTDMLLLFIFYECMLLPSFVFVYFVSPYKRAIQASLYFLIWTQLGSLLVLVGSAYIFYIVNSTSFETINLFSFSFYENLFLYFCFFFGFGFKVPMWPFHHWLTKTHVEAPAGFSMFLSGFLVKSAIYGFYKFSNFLNFEVSTFFFTVFLIVGIIDASLKMWGQTDLKKLIAYSTVQEMNLIYLVFCLGDSNAIWGGVIFCVTHAFLSSLLFYTVDCVQRRYHSRSIYDLSGINNSLPLLGTVIFFNCIFYMGVPGTLKFLSELYIFNGLLEIMPISLILILVGANLLGAVGFCKCWFNVLFGMTSNKQQYIPTDLSLKELSIVIICYFMLIFFNIFDFYVLL
jgi:NADH-quinone oxidoreductase subunit M